MSPERTPHSKAGQPIFLICFMALCMTSGIENLYAEDVSPGSGEMNSETASSNNQVSFVASPPTIPLPPPILPSFYNNPIGLDQVYAGRSLSHIFSVCGDGIYDPGEECDDGNRDSEDGCSDLCRLEDPLGCGDGKIGPGERCDDGNLADGDGCSATCQSEGMCGDGIVDPGEECDDGNKSPDDGCSRMCYLEIKEPVEKEKEVVEEPEDPVEEDSKEKEEKKEEDEKEPEEKVIDEPRVSYEPGRAVTTITGCTGSCTIEVTRSATGQILSTREILSERKLDPGATYTDPVFGEVNCATGRSVAMAQNSSAQNAEEAVSLRAAEIISCQL